MNVIRTETLSPAWFEGLWLACEQKLVAALAEGLRRVPLFSVILVLMMAGQWIWLVHLYSPRYPDHFAVRIWLTAEFAFYLSLLFAIAQSLWTSLQIPATRSAVSILIFCSTVVFCWFRASITGETGIIAGVVLAWVTLPLFLLFLHARGVLGRAGLLLSLALLFAIFPALYSHFFASSSVLATPAWYLVWTDRLMIPFVVVLTELWQQGVVDVFSLQSLSLLLQPALFFYVLPLSHQNLRHTVNFRVSLASAFLILIRVILFKALNMPLEKMLFAFATAHPHWSLETLYYGWMTYFDFFLFSYASLNLGIVVARCLGLGLEDGTHFALLAPTPIERWRRWNTYYYAWLFRFVFIPVYRRQRNWLLSIQIVFFVTFLLHASRAIAFCFLSHFPQGIVHAGLFQLVFFQAHGIAVYLSHYFPSWTQNSQSRRSWAGVVATHFIMAVVHILPLWSVVPLL